MIIVALALSLFQFWLLPASLNLKNIRYLISSRDTPAAEESLLQGRVSRAAANLAESLPAFLALSLLAIIQNVDLSHLAMIWLVLRLVYIPSYLFNIIYVRTVIWLASIACLVYMAIRLL